MSDTIEKTTPKTRPKRTDVISINLGSSSSDQDQYDKRICDKYVATLMHSSPLVVFLLSALEKSGCPIARGHIECVPCDELSSGSFSVDQGIKLCQNFISSEQHAEETLSHELIHAFDYCKRNFDHSNCRQHACSEIRASALSGDCKWINEFYRGKWNLRNQYKECVKRRAKLSLTANPACQGKDIESIVNEVFHTCIQDTSPFLYIPY